MKNLENFQFDSEEELRASNEVLKLKLELEHGMKIQGVTELSPQLENQWLQDIYSYEQRFKNVEKISVYDFIGRPPFAPAESLTPNQLHAAIDDLNHHMEIHGVMLNFFYQYDDGVIYQFITTEFFTFQMDNVRMVGAVQGFIYEDFHPNHDADLRKFSTDFLNVIAGGKWKEFECYLLGETVSLHDKLYTRSRISSIISIFQEFRATLDFEDLIIQNVTYNLESKKAVVRSDLAYWSTLPGKPPELIEGPCIIHFEMGSSGWAIVAFDIPGF